MLRPLRLACISDIHLGHRKNDARAIIANLDKYFSNDANLCNVDVVVLVGDVFDEALSLSADAVQYIDAWIARLLRLCRKYNIIVRVLEGTPSHDRKQSQRFTIINDIHEQLSGKHIDLKHVEELSIEYLPDFDINVLYVPDEWGGGPEKTLEDVKALMAEKGIEQLDFAFMHGQFEYQLPAHIKNMPRHSSHEYMALVKYLIFIGHIHLYSRNEKIIAQGSFDRLSHNEEGPKGFVKATVQPDGENEVVFIENVGAKLYITVPCPYEEVEENIKLIDRAVEFLADGSNVRLEAQKGNAMLSDLDSMRSRWPLLVWSLKVLDKDVKEESSVIPQADLYVPINIDRNNIVELVMERLVKLNLDPFVLQKCAMNMSEMQRI